MFRQLHLPLTLITAMALGACASTTKQSSLTKNPDAPAWIARGSVVKNGSVHGVGMVMGIRNVELARKTAGNRARAEISKIMSTYSASLMKDYSASTTAGDFSASSEEQSVEQAIKTFSANLLQGAEVTEVWFDPTQNAYFSLVTLNFEKSRQLAAKGLGGDMKKWVDENGSRILNDMEKESAPPPAAKKRSAPSTPPSGSSDAPPAADKLVPPPAAKKPDVPEEATKVGGPRPAWTDGKCDKAKYLCGVGDGPNRTSADNDSRAELARIFKANIQAVSSSFESASKTISSKTGENWKETQEVSRHSMVSTDKVVTMSQILKRWDSGKGTVYALAVIERAPASRVLRDKIEQIDRVVGSKLSQAMSSSDNLSKLQYLKGAMAALAEREALNSDLRIIDRSGRGIPPPHDVAEITRLLDAASDSISIGIALIGTAASDVQACLEEKLTDKGYQVEANSDEDGSDFAISGDFDVLIHGKVKAQKRGKVAGSHVVNTSLSLKLINAKTNKVIKTFRASRKASRSTVRGAVSTSVVQLCN
ncbi:MAG: LPP20 family lipoprotein, partial [Myxococcota bacterium]|nr:LPP20 family lipoprotein [Myxococcota bacterium]